MGQVVTSDVIKNLTPGLKTTFMQGWQGVELPYKQIVTTVDSTLPAENYAWLGQAPTLREWTDERVAKGLSEFSYTIRNKKWENTIKVQREVLEDEQYGQVKMRVAQLPGQVAKGQNRAVFNLLSASNSTVCYDGANMASTNHVEGNSGTQSNLLTSSPLTVANYDAARAKFAGFKDDAGELVGARATHLVVPRTLEGAARRLLNADFISDGQSSAMGGSSTVTNIWKGSADLIVSDWLADSTSWFLLDLSAYIKPIIWQNRVDTEFDHLTNDNGSDNAFMRDEFLFGTRGRWNVGFGDWRTMVMATA